MGRILLAVVLLSTAILTGCGCGDDRAPSGIAIELTETLAAGTYSFDVCVDEDCYSFGDLAAIGESLLGDADIYIRADYIRFTTWNAIEPGEHQVDLNLADANGIVLSFNGALDFEQVDRCHTTDAEATIAASRLTR